MKVPRHEQIKGLDAIRKDCFWEIEHEDLYLQYLQMNLITNHKPLVANVKLK